MRKRLLTVILTLALCLGLCTPASAAALETFDFSTLTIYDVEKGTYTLKDAPAEVTVLVIGRVNCGLTQGKLANIQGLIGELGVRGANVYLLDIDQPQQTVADYAANKPGDVRVAWADKGNLYNTLFWFVIRDYYGQDTTSAALPAVCVLDENNQCIYSIPGQAYDEQDMRQVFALYASAGETPEGSEIPECPEPPQPVGPFEPSEPPEPPEENHSFTIDENNVLTGYKGPGGDVVVPDGVVSIGIVVFRNCENLTSITIPDSVTSIDTQAFDGCTSLTRVNMGSGVTSIGNFAFRGCSNLTDITIPNSVNRIGSQAFKGCTSLTSVTIGSGVTSIGGEAFSGTPWLAEQGEFAIANGILVAYQGAGGAVVIPEGVTSIGNYAFALCESLTSVTIPEGVTSIGMQSFLGCSSLVNVDIPEGVTLIDSYAFSGCISLTSMTIPASVTTIKSMVFFNCTNLRELAVENGHVDLAGDWLSREEGNQTVLLEGVTIYAPPGGNVEAYCEATGQTFQPTRDYILSKNNVVLEYRGPGGVVVIEDGAVGVYWWAFQNCTNVTRVTLPEGVTYIDRCAFAGCSGLTDITIPKSVTRIGASVFLGCSALTGVVLPDGLTEIDACTFMNCTSLTDVSIPSSVTWIGRDAFEGCPNLTIHGAAGSYAQTFAEKNGIPFVEDTSAFAPRFSDVPADAYYAKAVNWAVSQGITNGTGDNTFSPEKICSHVEIITFLYRAAGSPAANAAASIQVESWFQDAVNWAYGEGIIDDGFNPSADCTRADTVAYMWKAAGSPAAEGEASFPDVPADETYAQAVAWAVSEGVTTGTDEGTFAPDLTCDRGQIVTFLMRACEK